MLFSILSEPSISATLKDNTIPILGEQYSLECTITGKNYLIDGTTCEIAWCKNGENFHTDNSQLSNTKSVKHEFGSLELSHKGRYTCKVTIKRDLVVILKTTSNHVDVQLSGMSLFMSIIIAISDSVNVCLLAGFHIAEGERGEIPSD